MRGWIAAAALLAQVAQTTGPAPTAAGARSSFPWWVQFVAGVIVGSVPVGLAVYTLARRKAKAEIKKLKAEVKKLKAEIGQIKDDAANTRADTATKQATLNATLWEQVHALQEEKQARIEERQNEDLTARLKTLEQQLDVKGEQLDNAHNRNARLEEQNEQQARLIEQLRKELDAYKRPSSVPGVASIKEHQQRRQPPGTSGTDTGPDGA